MKIFWGVLFLLERDSEADLPIHCTVPAISGVWEFRISKKIVQDGSACKNRDFSEDQSQRFEMELSTVSNSHQIRLVSDVGVSFRVCSAATSTAAWEPIYDEGFIINVGDSSKRIFYGQFAYEPIEGFPKQEKYVRPDGSTPGFRSDCAAVPFGWVLTRSEDGRTELACFSASKVREPPMVSCALENVFPVLPHLRSETSAPASFTSKFSIHQTLHRQGNKCGSCFVLAFAFAFERTLMNRYMAITGTSSTELLFNVDREALLSCSFSGTGCDGGYFSSLALDVSYKGVPSSGCMDTISEDKLSYYTGQAQACRNECFKDSANLHYTKGFIHLQSEAEIEWFLQNHGPVPIAIYIPESDTSIHSDRVYTVTRPSFVSEYWDYLNHGVVITGWDTDTSGIKYWTVYNPWGFEMKIQRGPGHDWIARYAIGIVPDVCRGYIYSKLSPEDKRALECN
jgi:hypothetical protein